MSCHVGPGSYPETRAWYYRSNATACAGTTVLNSFCQETLEHQTTSDRITSGKLIGETTVNTSDPCPAGVTGLYAAMRQHAPADRNLRRLAHGGLTLCIRLGQGARTGVWLCPPRRPGVTRLKTGTR